MIVTGYFALFLMGATLGLLGAGGSILSVPILHYFFNITFINASKIALLIVGITSVFGCASKYKLIAYQKGLLFSLPSMVSIFLTKVYLVPLLPHSLFGMSKDSYLSILFALVMLLAAAAMFRNNANHPEGGIKSIRAILAISVLIGILMGLISIGGGFIILPALVLLVGLGAKEAAATSLFIIAINASVGILSDAPYLAVISTWQILGFIGISVSGMLFGNLLSKKIDGRHLKKAFAIFLLGLAIIILIKETVIT